MIFLSEVDVIDVCFTLRNFGGKGIVSTFPRWRCGIGGGGGGGDDDDDVISIWNGLQFEVF